MRQRFFQHELVVRKIGNIHARAARQTVTWQIVNKHRITARETVPDDVAIKTGMIEIAMQDENRAFGCRYAGWHENLTQQTIAVSVKPAGIVPHAGQGYFEIKTVEMHIVRHGITQRCIDRKIKTPQCQPDSLDIQRRQASVCCHTTSATVSCAVL